MSQSSMELSEYFRRFGDRTTAVHSGLFLTHSLPKIERGASRDQICGAHIDFIQANLRPSALWIPLFNYDFPKTGRFSTRSSPSQLGSFTEYFRTRQCTWRTAVPMMSFGGTGNAPAELAHLIKSIDQEVMDPFGPGSLFDKLVENDGLIMFYGAPFTSCTFLHYVERAAGGPSYRYDKLFSGEVTTDDNILVRLKLNYHARPLGKGLEYDWARLEADLVREGILRMYFSGTVPLIRLLPARDLLNFWLSELKKDPLYFLNRETRDWVEPALHRLGRRFVLADFESTVKSL